MVEIRHIAMVAGVVAALILAIGINRIVVADGQTPATARQLQPDRGVIIAFKSDYFPLA